VILAKEMSRLTEKIFDSDLGAVMEKELSLLDDFMLNDIIEAALFSERTAPDTQVDLASLGIALGVWSIRHPLSLPPCFTHVQKTGLDFGISTIYEWPSA